MRSSEIADQIRKTTAAEKEVARVTLRRLRGAVAAAERLNTVTRSAVQAGRQYRVRLRQQQLIVHDAKRWAQPNFVGLLRAQDDLTGVACSAADPTQYRQRSLSPLTPPATPASAPPGVFFRNTVPSPLLAEEATGRRPLRRHPKRIAAAAHLLHRGCGSKGASVLQWAAPDTLARAYAAEGTMPPRRLHSAVASLLASRPPPKRLSAEGVNRLLRRLLVEDGQRRDRNLAALEDRVLPRRAPMINDPETQDALVYRLADEDVAARRARREEAQDSSFVDASAEGGSDDDEDDEERPGPWRKIDAETAAALAVRLSTDAVAAMRQRRERIEDELEADRQAKQKPSLRLAREAMNESVQRLHRGNSKR